MDGGRRRRRHSARESGTDDARAAWYAWWRSVRFACHFGALERPVSIEFLCRAGPGPSGWDRRQSGGRVRHPHPLPTVATGLDNPRQITYKKGVGFLVAEAGAGGEGPCMPGPEGGPVCYGNSGAITRIKGGNQTRVVLMAVGLGAFFIIGIRGVQSNLLREFALEAGPNTPDLFLIDIQADQVADLQQFLAARTGHQPRLLPVLRARITQVRGKAVTLDTVEDVRGRGSLAREYTVTYRPRLEGNERVIAGRNPFAGATVVNLSPAVAEEVGLDPFGPAGVLVLRTAAGPAQQVGLQAGDIIRAVNGRDIKSVSDLTSAVSMTLCQDKRLTHRALDRVGIRQPAQRLAGADADNAAFLAEHRRLVVKPVSGEQGQGVIGPKLTDEAWIHGTGELLHIYKTVSDGVPAKGMPSWRMQLSAVQVRELAAFVGTLRGKNLPGKAPEGVVASSR